MERLCRKRGRGKNTQRDPEIQSERMKKGWKTKKMDRSMRNNRSKRLKPEEEEYISSSL